MSYKIDFSIATSNQIIEALSKRIENIRLMRNMTQAQVASSAGISLRTLGRLEKGQDVSLDTFLRVLIALGIQSNLQTLLPDPMVRPIERVQFNGEQRKRARPKKSPASESKWTWGDDTAGTK
ncbi:MAG: helix-turn-helix transcriptional regulator [Anaerolineaceae bacterium]|nr:helix-turn-helix transcriptional regulator [Anaerolineaceae bacterium]